HSTSYFVEAIFEHHDPAQIELWIYHSSPDEDDVSTKFRKRVHTWRRVHNMGTDELCALIRRDRLDVLVDLAGHTALSRLDVIARRVAPVQATYLGWPSTTGIRAMDARITDRWSDPAGDADAAHTEALVRTRGPSCCFVPAPGMRAPHPRPPQLREGAV